MWDKWRKELIEETYRNPWVGNLEEENAESNCNVKGKTKWLIGMLCEDREKCSACGRAVCMGNRKCCWRWRGFSWCAPQARSLAFIITPSAIPRPISFSYSCLGIVKSHQGWIPRNISSNVPSQIVEAVYSFHSFCFNVNFDLILLSLFTSMHICISLNCCHNCAQQLEVTLLYISPSRCKGYCLKCDSSIVCGQLHG